MYSAIKLIHTSGSIRKAAAELANSPSALNRAVQAFEAELGFPVFERIPGGVRLSTAGELLIDVVDRHLTEFKELQRQLGSLRDGDIGELRISMGADIAAGIPLASVGEIERAFPGLSVEIVHDDTIESLKQRKVHLALLTNPATDQGVDVAYAHTCPVSCWTGSADPIRPKGLWELENIRVLLPSDGTGSRNAISHTLRRNRLVLHARSSLPAGQIERHLLRSGGIAVFPETVFGAGDVGGAVRRLPFDFGTVQLCILHLSNVPLTRPANAFLNVFQRQVEHTLD